MSLSPGVRVKQYYIEERIGGGGMGAVWRARDTVRNENVAIKSVANDLVFDPEFRLRMQDEARRHQRLHHPNIVPVPDVFEADGETCIVMKLIDGQSLAALLAQRPGNRLGVEEAVHIITRILDALDYAHQHGIVHRDVKPTNVMMDGFSGVWLLDFGIAMAMGEKRRTRTGQTIGTLAYMSPEQISRPHSIDHRTDVYSVGCMFYEMLTGRPPFVKNQDGVADSDFAMQQAHVNNTPVHPKERVPGIPDDVDEIIVSALKKNPDERIPGCGEFLRLLADRAGNVNRGIRHSWTEHRATMLILGFLAVMTLIVFIFVR